MVCGFNLRTYATSADVARGRVTSACCCRSAAADRPKINLHTGAAAPRSRSAGR
jgi:hypothetical protein